MTDPAGGLGWRASTTPYSFGGLAERAAHATGDEPPPARPPRAAPRRRVDAGGGDGRGLRGPGRPRPRGGRLPRPRAAGRRLLPRSGPRVHGRRGLPGAPRPSHRLEAAARDLGGD